MRVVLSRCVLGAICLIMICAPAIAQAAAPAPGPVTVRVEGTSATLLPPTVVATVPGSYKPHFGGGNSCSGTSAAEALDLAALADGTSWGGTFNSGFGDFFVTAIGGELHPAGSTDGSYWSFWYNHAPAQTGICGQQLSAGDQILFFPDCFSPCPVGFVSPSVLGLTVPAIAQKGAPVSVSATSYANADGTPSPANAATVSGGGASATTTGGAATLTFQSVGTFVVRATAPNSIRSEPQTICVHDGNDGNCGTSGPPPTTPPPGTTTTPPPPPSTTTTPPPPPCVHAGDDGRCGTPDKTPPRGTLSITEGTYFARGHGPHIITGRVAADPSGVPKVRLRVLRVVPHGHGRCQAFDGKARRFVSAKCAVTSAPAFVAGAGSIFAYLLPGRLATGRYTVVMEAIDGAGNHDARAPGRDEIVFRVR